MAGDRTVMPVAAAAIFAAHADVFASAAALIS